MESTTNRLSTGKKVSSAIDNPTNYFAAENYNKRADALEGRLDSMGEATQMINAADNGITTIKSFLSQMTGIVNNALSNTDSGERQKYGAQFNELITQIRDAAKDSSYGGINLVYNNASTTVQFGENIGDSTLELQGFNISAASGKLDSNSELGASAATDNNGKHPFALSIDINGTGVVGIKSAGTHKTAGAAAVPTLTAANVSALDDAAKALTKVADDYITANKSADKGQALTDISTKMGDVISAANKLAGSNVYSWDATNGVKVNGDDKSGVKDDIKAVLDGLHAVYTKTDATADNNNAIANGADVTTATKAVTDVGGTLATFDTNAAKAIQDAANAPAPAGVDDWEIDWGSTNYQTELKGLISGIETMESTLQTQSSKLANNLAIITQREDYTNNAIDILNNGANDLTLADMNEEGANLLSLQTSQSLAVQALSLSSSSAANVLSILR